MVSSRLRPGSFTHNVMVMFVGTALGQFGAVLLAPILTRMYSPEAFGVLGAFTAILTILSVIASLRYELALPLAREPQDAANLLAVCGVSLLFTTFISIVVIWLISVYGDISLGLMEAYQWLFPLGFLCIGAYQIMVYYATQQSAFSAIAQTKIYQGLTGPLTQIGLGLTGSGIWGLIIGFIVGQSTGSVALFSKLVLKKRELLHGVSLPGMKDMAKRFIRFPMLSSWSGLINALGTSYLLLVIVPVLYSHTIAGFVFLTDRIIGRPLLLISTSIMQVYMGDVSRSLAALDPKAVRRRFLKLAGAQLVIVAGWLLLVNVTADWLFPIIFGQEWGAAVPYLYVLSIGYLPQMVMHSLVHTLQILERQGLSALWEIGRLAAVIGAFVISYVFGLDALHALLLYSVAQASAQAVLFLLMFQSIESLQQKPTDA